MAENCKFIYTFVVTRRNISILIIMGSLLKVISKGTLVMTLAAAGTMAYAVPMRFHCERDTLEVNELLVTGKASGLHTGNALVTFYAEQLLDRPYVGHTLEGDEEQLTINIDELDCTTFVETLYALARTTLEGRTSWRDYAHNLENVRYRSGKMSDYASRLHYISDWLMDNRSRNNVEEVTADVKGVRYKIKTINYMSQHRDSYPSLADSTQFAKVRNVEGGYVNHRYPYIRKEALGSKDVENALRSGDMVGLVTTMEGLDISHLGILKKGDDGKLYLLDASSVGKKVMLEPLPLVEQLRQRKSVIGIRVWRLKQ